MTFWCFIALLYWIQLLVIEGFTLGHLRTFQHALFIKRGLCLGGLKSIALFLVAFTVAVQSHASAGGRSGFSGNPQTSAGATCTVSHAPDGAETPGMGILGPVTLDAGAT